MRTTALRPEEFRALHAANPTKCCEGCPGWAVFDVGTERVALCRCDSCWYEYRNDVNDDDVAELPEARAELRLATGPSARWHDNRADSLVVAWAKLAESHPRLAGRLRSQAHRHRRQAVRVRTYEMHGEVLP